VQLNVRQGVVLVVIVVHVEVGGLTVIVVRDVDNSVLEDVSMTV